MVGNLGVGQHVGINISASATSAMLSGCLPGYLFGPQLQLMADTGTVPSVTSPDEYGHAKPTGLPQQPPTLGKHRPGGRGRCSSMACNTCLQGILSWVLAGKLET